MTPQRVILGAWIACIGLATVKRVTDPSHAGFPPPSVYLGSAVLFTALYGASAFAGPLAATLAVGVDVGLLVRPYLPGTGAGASPLTTLASWLDNLSGATPPAQASTSGPASSTA